MIRPDNKKKYEKNDVIYKGMFVNPVIREALEAQKDRLCPAERVCGLCQSWHYLYDHNGLGIGALEVIWQSRAEGIAVLGYRMDTDPYSVAEKDINAASSIELQHIRTCLDGESFLFNEAMEERYKAIYNALNT